MAPDFVTSRQRLAQFAKSMLPAKPEKPQRAERDSCSKTVDCAGLLHTGSMNVYQYGDGPEQRVTLNRETRRRMMRGKPPVKRYALRHVVARDVPHLPSILSIRRQALRLFAEMERIG